MIDLELHSHTHYSRDSLSKLPDIVKTCRDVGIDRIAITDHS
jgi:predicted metal-dependent phosphoesterase TrpH